MNKISKYAGLLAFSAFGMFALNSCDDAQNNGDYSLYDGETPDVYFPVSTTQTVTAGESTRDFTFVVYRASTSASSSVSLSWSGDVTPFTLPTTASFDADAVTTEVTVEFVSQDLTPQTPYNLTVTIAGTETTELTQNFLDFEVTYYPMSEFEPFGYNESLGRDGQGYYVFSKYYSGTENPVLVLSSYSLVDPNQMEFQFQWLIDNDDPSLGWETFLTATSSDGGKTIRVPEQGFAYNSSYGTVYVSDMYYYTGNSSYNNSYFDDETGTFYLDLIYYVSAGYFGYGYETCVLNGYMDTNDYTVTLSDNGAISIDGENYEIVNFTWTDAVEMVLYTAVETSSLEEDGEISQALIDELAEKLFNGEVEGSVVETQGNVALSFATSDNFTVVALGIASDQSSGEYTYKSTAYISFDYTSADPNAGWTSLGTVQYTDGYMCALYSISALTWGVEMQENDDQPGYYRLVNPYGAAYPYNESGDYDPDVNSYLYINAVDPDGVFIEESPQTIDWGAGAFTFYSMAAYYMDYGGYPLETVKNAGYCGTLENGKITFPAKTLATILGSKIYSGNYAWDADTDYEDYIYNSDGSIYAPFCVDMNTLTSTTSAKAKSRATKVEKGNAAMKNAEVAGQVKKQAKVVKYSSKKMETKRHETILNSVKNGL